MFPKDVPRISPYGPLCNAKGCPLLTSWGRPLLPSSWHWNMTSSGCIKVASSGRPHIVLYVMPRDVLYWRLKDVSCKRYEDLTIWPNIWLQGTCPTNVLRISFLDVLNISLHGSISKAKKCSRDKTTIFGLSINVILLKWPPPHSRLTIQKREYELHVLNWITYIYFFHQIFYQILFLSSKLPNFTAKLTIH